jgi:hypothetical protein
MAAQRDHVVVDAGAGTARKQHERLLCQRFGAQFATRAKLAQCRMVRAQHGDQRIAKQSLRCQSIRQHIAANDADLQAVVEQGIDLP